MGGVDGGMCGCEMFRSRGPWRSSEKWRCSNGGNFTKGSDGRAPHEGSAARSLRTSKYAEVVGGRVLHGGGVTEAGVLRRDPGGDPLRPDLGHLLLQHPGRFEKGGEAPHTGP